MQTISILGCGWLGLPLAVQLVKAGYPVKGSTTDPINLPSLKEHGIQTQVLTYSPDRTEEAGDFFLSDVLFLNIPFKRSLDDPRYYAQQIKAVLDDVREGAVSLVIFASSTSIYADEILSAAEDASLVFSNERARVLHEIEQMILKDGSFDGTVIRFGGLVGGERRVGRFLAGKRKLKDPHKPVNLIHRDDCVRIVQRIIETDARGEIFNAVCDGHPSRKELYTEAAEKMGLKPPRFEEEGASGPYKTVTNQKIKKALQYQFVRSDPKEFA